LAERGWKDKAELIGIAAIVASLIFVGVEIRQSQSAANVSQIAGYGEMQLALRATIMEYADVWHRACADEELSPAESIQAAQLMRAYIEFTFTQGVTADLGMFDYREIVIGRYAANVHRYPGFARMASADSEWSLLAHRSGNIDELATLIDMVRTKIAALQELEPNPQYDVSQCGL
jgi:hypothetical protein